MNALSYCYLADVLAQPIAGKPEIKKIPNNCSVVLQNLWPKEKLPIVWDEPHFSKKEWDNYDKPLQNFRMDLDAPMIGLRPSYGSYYRC